MSRTYFFVCLLLANGAWFLSGCPTLKGVDIPCESGFDCPTDFGCAPSNICVRVSELTLTMEPYEAKVLANDSVTFSAKLNGQNITRVSWSVEGKGTGTINDSGVYAAPSGITIPIRIKIWATLNSNPDFKVSATVTVVPADDTVAWVMSYYQGETGSVEVAKDSLYLAYSKDRLQWTVLSPTEPAYRLSQMGSNRLRDPYLLRKLDGTFVILATDWTLTNSNDYVPSPNIIVIDSPDLITFMNPRLLRVTLLDHSGVPMHAWAPEAFYDPYLNEYGILWAGNDENDINRIYVSYTTDFQQIRNNDPIVFFDPGYSVVNPTLVQTFDRNYLLFKDDRPGILNDNILIGQDIQIAGTDSSTLTPGAFKTWSSQYITRGSNQSTILGTNAPYVVMMPIESWSTTPWYMCSSISGSSPGCWSTEGLDVSPNCWVRLDMYGVPADARGASTIRVTQAELDALIEHYGTVSGG